MASDLNFKVGIVQYLWSSKQTVTTIIKGSCSGAHTAEVLKVLVELGERSYLVSWMPGKKCHESPTLKDTNTSI